MGQRLAGWGRAICAWAEGAAGACQPAWPFLLGLALIALSVLERLDGALRVKHALHAPSGGVGDVASPLAMINPGRVGEVVAGWRGVDSILLTYAVVDIVLMSLVAVLTLILRSTVIGLLQQQAVQGPTRPVVSRLPAARRAAAVVSALRWSTPAVLGYLVADLLETTGAVALGLAVTGVIAPGVLNEATIIVAVVLGVVSTAKWVLLLLSLMPVALAVAGLGSLRRRASAGLLAVRGLAVVAAVLVAVFVMLRGDIGRQIDDVVGHAAQSRIRATVVTLLALATSWVMVVGGRRCLAAYRDRPDVRPLKGEQLVRVGSAAGLLVVVGLLLAFLRPNAYQAAALALLVLPGVGVLSWCLLSAPPGVRRLEIVDMRPGSPAPPMTWVWVLASVPPLLLLLIVVRATTTVWTVGGEPPPGLLAWSLLLAGGLGSILAWARARMVGPGGEGVLSLGKAPPAGSPRQQGQRWILLAVLLLVVAAFGPEPRQWMMLGSVGVVFLFAFVTSIGMVGLTLLGDALAPRGALAVTGLRRLPVMTLLVVWGLVASLMDTEGRYYDVPLLDPSSDTTTTEPDGREATTSDGALTTWLESTGEPQEQDRSLVFVTASGGGIRAAYWTHLVWECAFGIRCGENEVREKDASDQVFMASGVSGGAVGLSLVLGGTTSADGRAELLSNDFLAPTVAAALARDLPNSVLRLPWSGHDRATTLADAVASFDDGLRDPFSAYGRRPHLAVSGTSVEDGCRFTLSTVQQVAAEDQCAGAVANIPGDGPEAAPVRDGLTYLCDRAETEADIRLVDAAFLSARFPYVSPTASLRPCDDQRAATYVLDGGMFDNSGGSSVTAVLTDLANVLDEHNAKKGAGCVIPRLLVIENQFESGARREGVGRPLQSLGPAQTLLSFYGDRSDRELARTVDVVLEAADRAHELCRPNTPPLDPQDVVAVVHPVVAGGAAAPLGWTLAESTRKAMAEQVHLDCEAVGAPRPAARPGPDDVGRDEHDRETCKALRTVRSWVEP